EWISEHVPSGILIMNGRRNVVFANRVARTWLGFEGHDNPEDFFAWCRQGFECRPEKAWALARTGMLGSGERLNLVKPAREDAESSETTLRIFSIDSLPLSAGEETHRVFFMRDATADLEQHHSLWSLKSAIDHKMRTPLNGLLGTLELLATDEGDFDEEERREFLRTALDSALRLSDTFQGLEQLTSLAVRRFPGGDGVQVAEIEAMVRKVARESHIAQLDYFRRTHDVGSICLDSRRLEIILRELFENSYKFHPRHDPHLIVRLQERDNKLRLTICDNGRWVKHSQIDQVLMPFFQAEDAYTGEISGGGLGLPAVARMMWSEGGEVEVFNREDKPGFGVHLILPRDPADIVSPSEAPPSAAETETETEPETVSSNSPFA
ncbi:MAG: sensor histidine kinase, partial [Verrucomicrobiota bacterium]